MLTNERDEKVTAGELLDCLWVATMWLKEVPADRLNDARGWPGLVDAVLLLQQRLSVIVKDKEAVIVRPAELTARGVGTTGTTGCGGKP